MKRDDKEMIENPDRWPCSPFLPVKRDGWKQDNFANPKHLGIIHAARTTVVIKTNFAMLAQLGVEELVERCSVYDSVDALLADGWMVD